jgi:hypothetical protein
MPFNKIIRSMQGLLQPHPQPLPRIRGGELKNFAWGADRSAPIKDPFWEQELVTDIAFFVKQVEKNVRFKGGL